MGAVKRTHPRAVVRQKIHKYIKRDPEKAIPSIVKFIQDLADAIYPVLVNALSVAVEMVKDWEAAGIDLGAGADQTGYVEKIEEAHDEQQT